MEGECGFCGGTYQKNRSWQVFCSESCRRAAKVKAMAGNHEMQKKLKALKEEVQFLRSIYEDLGG